MKDELRPVPRLSASRVVAGMDEAGLGPLLGPLAIGWSVLRLPQGGADPWRLLAPFVSKGGRSKRAKLLVADSKRVFNRTAAGARRLEETALAFLAQLADPPRVPRRAQDVLFGALRPEPGLVERHPWYDELASLPAHAPPDTLELTGALLARRLAAQGLELLDAGVRVVPAGELNRSYEETGNKGTTVWARCAEVLEHLWRCHGEEGPDVTVDILGGRQRYGALLARAFPDAELSVLEESHRHAIYRLDERERTARGRWMPRRMRIEFLAKGEEASFCVALASCLAKYARELSMDAFNAWFGRRQEDLAPTAGYTQDGRRWLEDARTTIERAGVDRATLVRTR